MTARTIKNPDGTNKAGNGRGVRMHTKPVTKKRGASADRTKVVPALRNMPNTSTYAGAALVSPDKPLTDQQRAFVRFWASGESITAASIKAGYNDGASIAYRMTKMPNIQRLYDEEKTKYEEASQMTRKKVMDMHMEAFDMAKLMAEPSSMVSAAREIGKMCGYYEPTRHTVDISVTGNVVLERMNRLSDAELLKLITQGGDSEPMTELQLLNDGDDI